MRKSEKTTFQWPKVSRLLTTLQTSAAHYSLGQPSTGHSPVNLVTVSPLPPLSTSSNPSPFSETAQFTLSSFALLFVCLGIVNVKQEGEADVGVGKGSGLKDYEVQIIRNTIRLGDTLQTVMTTRANAVLKMFLRSFQKCFIII